MSELQAFQPNFLTIKDFCNRNQMSRSSLYNHINSGLVKIVKLGRKTLIPIGEERAFIERLLAA